MKLHHVSLFMSFFPYRSMPWYFCWWVPDYSVWAGVCLSGCSSCSCYYCCPLPEYTPAGQTLKDSWETPTKATADKRKWFVLNTQIPVVVLDIWLVVVNISFKRFMILLYFDTLMINGILKCLGFKMILLCQTFFLICS